MHRTPLVSLALAAPVLLTACPKKKADATADGGSTSASASAPTPAASASAAEAFTAPFDDGDATQIPAAKMKDDAERDKKGAAALAGVKIDAKADLSVAPKDGVYANILGRFTTLDSVEMTFWSDKWTIKASNGVVGPSLSFGEAQVAQKKFGKALKYGDGFFQMPNKENAKTWPIKDFKQTTSMNSDNAYNIEITKFQPGTFAAPGKCSGRFTLYYELKFDPKGPLWATGTFKNVKCYRSGK